jgi:hypothetical protein
MLKPKIFFLDQHHQFYKNCIQFEELKDIECIHKHNLVKLGLADNFEKLQKVYKGIKKINPDYYNADLEKTKLYKDIDEVRMDILLYIMNNFSKVVNSFKQTNITELSNSQSDKKIKDRV